LLLWLLQVLQLAAAEEFIHASRAQLNCCVAKAALLLLFALLWFWLQSRTLCVARPFHHLMDDP
jgi:hypothetical protein